MNTRRYDMDILSGFDPQIGSLLMLLNVSKARIEEKVSGLDISELDYAIDDYTPTVGTLLKHMIFVEDWYRLLIIENRNLNDGERLFWDGCLPGPGKLLDRKIKGNQITYYINLWGEIRKKTVSAFAKKDDAWLYLKSTGEFNNYFCWFHVLEDQLCHLGQIKYILKRLPC